MNNYYTIDLQHDWDFFGDRTPSGEMIFVCVRCGTKVITMATKSNGKLCTKRDREIKKHKHGKAF